MGVSYKRLWKLLIDRDMTKGELSTTAQIATSTVSRMSRNGYVSLEVLEKICNTLNCQLNHFYRVILQHVASFYIAVAAEITGMTEIDFV